MKYLAECLDKEGISALRLFKMADKNFNQVLTVDELKEQVKVMLPESFAGLNYKKLLKAFDLNGNGLIEQEEFVGLLEMAKNSGADTSVFSKIPDILGTTGAGDKRWQKAAEGAY